MLATLLFHVLTVRDMATDPPGAWRKMHTHVEVTGFVTYIAKEDDGDTHIRICDSPKVTTMDRSRCVVAECIPALPCKRPKVGSRVTVRGISRYDGERGHLWNEVHPVLSMKEARP